MRDLRDHGRDRRIRSLERPVKRLMSLRIAAFPGIAGRSRVNELRQLAAKRLGIAGEDGGVSQAVAPADRLESRLHLLDSLLLRHPDAVPRQSVVESGALDELRREDRRRLT